MLLDISFGQIGKKFVFATTTPVPNVTTSLGRTYELAVEYNKQAEASLQAADIHLDDLWSVMVDHCGAGYVSCDWQLPKNVHLSKLGCETVGKYVSDFILDLL